MICTQRAEKACQGNGVRTGARVVSRTLSAQSGAVLRSSTSPYLLTGNHCSRRRMIRGASVASGLRRGAARAFTYTGCTR
jgi:hypothetical protein